MSGLAETLVAELRAFAADLLDPGLAPALRWRRGVAYGGGLGAVVEQAATLAGIVPRLLDELDVSDYSFREEELLTRVPVRALLPRRPMDWIRHEGRLVPQRWTTILPVPEPDVRPLGWLLHIVGLMQDVVVRAQQRLGKHFEEAIRSRRGTSEFARADTDALRALEAGLDRARTDLDRAAVDVMEAAGFRLQPTHHLPRPFPRAPSWTSLRELADPLVHPGAGLPGIVGSLLQQPVLTADLPFLYQRWCGVKVIESLRGMGFETRDDPVPPLFLGGRVRCFKEGVRITLWCEPRLTRGGDHECGLYCERGEATPDYVFIVPGPGCEDAYILDPTLDKDQDVRALKSRYLAQLAFRRLPLVAGVPAVRHPLRAWAAAPLDLPHCHLDSRDGTKGTVPMNPVRFDTGPLRHWLSDIEAHAAAWSVRS